MTDQIPDKIRIDLPDFTLGAWRLYGVRRGSPHEDAGWGSGNAYHSDPGKPQMYSRTNPKGFVPHYVLLKNGRLILERFTYDLPLRVAGRGHSSIKQCDVNETLDGSFFLVLKRTFLLGPRLFIPFRDGAIITDQAQWLHEGALDLSSFTREILSGCPPDFPG